MAKRREKGDGSIYQRESDGRYVAYARLENGAKKYVYDKTRSGVAKKLKELQRDIEQGMIVKEKGETVEIYLWYWLDIRRKQNQIKESTYTNYKYYIQIACKHIGDIKLTKLTGDKLQQMYSKLQSNNKASTVNLIHRILSIAFKYAIKWKKLANNPCKDAEAPIGEKFEGTVLTAAQGNALLIEAKGHPITHSAEGLTEKRISGKVRKNAERPKSGARYGVSNRKIGSFRDRCRSLSRNRNLPVA